jgi:hypothetical protein
MTFYIVLFRMRRLRPLRAIADWMRVSSSARIGWRMFAARKLNVDIAPGNMFENAPRRKTP